MKIQKILASFSVVTAISVGMSGVASADVKPSSPPVSRPIIRPNGPSASDIADVPCDRLDAITARAEARIAHFTEIGDRQLARIDELVTKANARLDKIEGHLDAIEARMAARADRPSEVSGATGPTGESGRAQDRAARLAKARERLDAARAKVAAHAEALSSKIPQRIERLIAKVNDALDAFNARCAAA